ncbi:putative CfxQ-like protein [Moumouvirus australiensis]|uniref:Putative CfxQ-like protein n=1 Tax=Moumouvirus australiensis TaxID=2109587 RepID=A0A2P1EL71_9VIRU|nr:putative CfxQ-like protein [Moumouvirus australiensis]AVL94617.1 putative CfxQ-like protein [Moumouvirus australiensis]
MSRKRCHDEIITDINEDNEQNNSDKNKDNTDNKNKKNRINLTNKRKMMPNILFILGESGINEIFDDPKDNSEILVPEYICPGINCDHDILSQNMPKIPENLLNPETRNNLSIGDLINLGGCYHCKLQQYYYNIPLERLAKLRNSLIKLNNVIGMKNIKEVFVEQIIYFLLDLEPNPSEMLHTILEGPPGVGKSYVIDILAEIYLNMGYLTNGVVKKVKLNDLKGKYIGHSAPLTQKAIDEAMGGVLVIDEAYSLGNHGSVDVFSKEVIDTLNRNLTENAGKFICILAGYGEEIEKCLFAHNIGLKSRFRFKFSIDKYSPQELYEILKIKITNDKWFITNEEEIINLFIKNHNKFKYFGRDIETLLFHTKMAHSKRIIFETENNKIINLQDMENGLKKFLEHNSDKNNNENIEHMYL